jgi:hypothetical protein
MDEINLAQNVVQWRSLYELWNGKNKARIYLLTEQLLAIKLHCQLEHVYLMINVGNKELDIGDKIILDLRYFCVSLCYR